MFRIDWKESAIKELEKLDRSVSSRIFKKIDELKNDIYAGDVKKLQNSEFFRLRVGDYRVIFSVDANLVTILKIGHRSHIYDRM